MPLDPNKAEPLTSRQIAKLISGLMCSFIYESGADSICEVLDHLVANHKHYKKEFKEIERSMKGEIIFGGDGKLH